MKQGKSMGRIASFPPIAAPDARLLILGSMPGEMSLQMNQYYAHPRNQFWPIMTGLLDAKADLPYPEKAALLKRRRIALWDVLHSCIRPGSLDSDIRQEIANDFPSFFAAHPSITTVFFNGRKAEHAFRKQVAPVTDCGRFSFHVLPSTSPANASFTFERKCNAWRKITDSAEQSDRRARSNRSGDTGAGYCTIFIDSPLKI